MSCLRDYKTCVFEDACVYRRQFLVSMRNKRMSATTRYVKQNGYCTNGNHYIPTKSLVSLSQVYLMTGFKCWYCGEKMYISNNPDACDDDICTLDHRISIAAGGTNSISNFVFCCRKCNNEKGLLERPELFDTKSFVKRMNARFGNITGSV